MGNFNRFFSWMWSAVMAKKWSEVEVPGEEDGDLRKRKPRLEIENLADVIDDFKMVRYSRKESQREMLG